MTPPVLPGFDYRRADVAGVTINCAVAGSGPPLLLHGYPQNHLVWRQVAPGLARDHTVVPADLRGYGDSAKPKPDQTGRVYSKRFMARDQVGLMRELGFARFGQIGHDRGARVAHRLALEHAEPVKRLAVLDIVPCRHVFGHVSRRWAWPTTTGSSWPSRPASPSTCTAFPAARPKAHRDQAGRGAALRTGTATRPARSGASGKLSS